MVNVQSLGRVTGGARVDALDRVRGAAVALMVLDHLCAWAIGLWASMPAIVALLLLVVRVSLDRAALPLFMLSTGMLLAARAPSNRSRARVAMLGVVVSVACGVVGSPLGVPDILVVWSLVMLLWRVVVRYPVWCVVFGLVQTYAWPLSYSMWGSYQPGTALALLSCGVLGGLPLLSARVLRGLPRWCAVVGRHALAWYVVHVSLLLGVWVVWS